MAFSQNRVSTDGLTAAQRVFPGGTLGKYAMPQHERLLLSHGEGSTVVDVEGRSYIDYVIGSGPMLLGHAHPAVVEAVRAQAGRGTQFYWLTEPAIELAETIIEAAPCAEQLRFCSTGAEATFYALRIARAFTGRDVVVRFRGSYHGNHDYSMVGASKGIPAGIESTVLTAPYNDIEGTTSLVEQHADEIAAIIVEPMVQRTVASSAEFLAGLRALADRVGCVLIFDEVVTGFRLAWGGAQEVSGVVPDLATYGKVIGGGLPLAAVAGRQELLDVSNPDRDAASYAYVSGTLNGNPLAAAAGLATLRTLRDTDAYARLARSSARFRSGLEDIAAGLPRRMRLLGVGPVVGVTFADGDITDPTVVDAADKSVLRELEARLVQRGVFANVPAKFYVSVAHTDEDIDVTLQAIKDELAHLL
jgi:glutamate-1-semialdehyde 2,1-aminomutase